MLRPKCPAVFRDVPFALFDLDIHRRHLVFVRGPPAIQCTTHSQEFHWSSSGESPIKSSSINTASAMATASRSYRFNRFRALSAADRCVFGPYPSVGHELRREIGRTERGTLDGPRMELGERVVTGQGRDEIGITDGGTLETLICGTSQRLILLCKTDVIQPNRKVARLHASTMKRTSTPRKDFIGRLDV